MEAARWFRAAAEQGHAPAQFNLGQLYRKGLGVEQDFGAAHAWATLAVDGGFPGGLILRGGLEEFMAREEIEAARRLAKTLRAAIRKA